MHIIEENKKFPSTRIEIGIYSFFLCRILSKVELNWAGLADDRGSSIL